MHDELRTHARAIWHAAVAAVGPEPLVRHALADLADELRAAPRILVVGAGKAGAAMAAAVEEVLADRLNRVEGIVNVPMDAVRPLQKIRLHAARPAATNFPTAEGVAGADEMLRLAKSAGPNDVAPVPFVRRRLRAVARSPRPGSPLSTNSPSPGSCTIAARPSTS